MKLTTRIFRLLAPRTGNDRSRIFLQQLAGGLGPGTPLAKRPVELDKRDAEAFQLGTDLVERGLGRAGQEAEDHRDKGNQHGYHKLDEIGRLSAPMSLGQERSDEETKGATAKQNHKKKSGSYRFGHDVCGPRYRALVRRSSFRRDKRDGSAHFRATRRLHH